MSALVLPPAACGVDETAAAAAEHRARVEGHREGARSPLIVRRQLAALHRREARTLKDFQKEYGAKVKYVEEINDNNEFFGKVRQQYEQRRLGRARHPRGHRLDGRQDDTASATSRSSTTAALPNVDDEPDRPAQVAAVRPQARLLDAPWQSGFAGIIYRKDKVKREPKSVDDLFDPDYKGKVTMLTEMRDTVGARAQPAMGADPEKATDDEFLKAIDKIGEGVRTRARSAASPATSTRRTSPRATPG